MSKLKKISSKFVIKNALDYIPIYRRIKICKYNKKYLSLIQNGYDNKKDLMRDLFLLKKTIKPIANCEDYIPIMQRILQNHPNQKNFYNLFIQYLNENKKFCPQINKIKDFEKYLEQLDAIKIGFNREFIDNFYNNGQFNFEELIGFCDKYGNKISEITFMDNNVPSLLEKKESYLILMYIIKNSNLRKIEDKCFFQNDKSLLTQLLNLDNDDYIEKYYIDNNIDYNPNKNAKDIVKIINGLQKYSLYFTESSNYNNIIKSFVEMILLNAKNLEELEITTINLENTRHFLNLLQKLNKLRALSITSSTDNPSLYNQIANVFLDNTFKKLEINVQRFSEGNNIIKKNAKSLEELTLKINSRKDISLDLVQVLSKLVNLKKLKILAKIPLINKDNIKCLSFPSVQYLEMPLCIKKYMFDLNTFFEKVPKLKKLKLNGVYLTTDLETIATNAKMINNIKLNENHLQSLKKIIITDGQKNATVLIFKIINQISNLKINENIKKIKIENCQFDKNLDINTLMKPISLFHNLRNLQLNNVSFQNGKNFFYDKMDNFKYLDKFYFKGLDCEKYNIHILSFLSYLSEKCKYLNDIGISNKKLNSDDMNLVLGKLTSFKYLTKVSIFDNYTFSDYFAYRDKYYSSTIDFKQIKNHYLVDLRNIDVKKNEKDKNTESYFSPKININDYLNDYKKKTYINKVENYYSFQNLFNAKSHTKVMHYLKEEKNFVIDEFFYTIFRFLFKKSFIAIFLVFKKSLFNLG